MKILQWKTATTAQWYGLLFLLCSILFVSIRIYLFFFYNLKWIDTDQPFMWLGARDYSNGLFYEPRYYGQDYNTFFEALVAVPFVWLSLPVYIAVPLATNLVYLFPYLFTAAFLFRRGLHIAACLGLGVIICMPPAYDLINSLPRGFVTAVFFNSFLVISLLEPKNNVYTALNVSMSLIGFFVHPGSLLAAAPVLFYVWLNNLKNKRIYLIAFVNLILAIPLHLFFDGFYSNNPDFVKNDLHVRLSTAFFMDVFSNLDAHFGHISFFFEGNSLLLLLVLLATPCALFMQKQFRFGAAWLLFIGLVLTSFCSGKVLEGSTWAYMSFSRFYLGIPFFLVLSLGMLRWQANRPFPALMLLLAFGWGIFKLINMDTGLKRHFDDRHWVGVHLMPLETALDGIRVYGSYCRENKVDFFLISHGFWMNTVLAYGGPAVDEKFPSTMETKSDKRYWVRNKRLHTVIPRFIFLSSTLKAYKDLSGYRSFKAGPGDDYGLVLIENNTLPLEIFIGVARRYEYAY